MSVATSTVPRGTSTPTLQRIPLASIDTADNVRSTIIPAEDEELAASIRSLGVLQPVTVWETPPGRYQVRYGHRRVRAAKLAGLTEIPAIVSEDAATATRTAEQLVENLQRSDLSALDEARALRDMLEADRDLTQAALAQRLGRSAPWVANTLGLLKAPPEIRDLLAEGKLQASHVKALTGVPAKDAVHLAKRAAENQTSAHQLERDAKYYREAAAQEAKRQDHSKAAVPIAAKTLEDAGVAKGSTVIVVATYPLDGDTLRKALAAAGWKPSDKTWAREAPEGCDCTTRALRVERSRSTSATILRTCEVDDHFRSAADVARAAQVAAAEERDRLRAAASDAIARSLLEQPPHPIVTRVLLWYAQAHQAGDWQALVARDDAVVAQQLAEVALNHRWYGVADLPFAEIAAALPSQATP